MSNNEWPLIFFTLISQMTAGLVATFATLLTFKKQMPYLKEIAGTAILTSVFLMTSALLISFLHLGSPLNALYAFGNLSGSWLSREILLVSLFWVLLVIWLLAYSVLPLSGLINKLMPLICALTGMTMIYTMARLYMVPTIPPWNSLSTMINFYASSIILGPLILLSLFQVRSKTGMEAGNFKAILLVLFSLMIIVFVVRFVIMMVPESSAASPVFAPDIIPLWIRSLYYLLVSGGLVILYIILLPSKNMVKRVYFILPVFVFFFLAEIIARYIFYAGYYSAGV